MAEKKIEIVAKFRDEVSRHTRGLRENLNRFAISVGNGFKAATRAVFNLRTALATLPAVLAVKQFADAASSIDDYRSQLTALIGDQAEANRVLGEIRDFARQSPLQTQEIIDSFIQLRAVGIKSAVDVTKTLGNVALIFNRDLRDVASGFISFETEVLRRLGVEMQRTGDTATLVSGDIRIQTQNTADAIRAGLLEIWEKRFPNAMELAGARFSAKMAVFKSNVFELSADIGEQLLPALKDVLDGVNSGLEGNRQSIVVWGRTFIQVGIEAATKLREILSAALFEPEFWAELPRQGTEAMQALARDFVSMAPVLSNIMVNVAAVVASSFMGELLRRIGQLADATGLPGLRKALFGFKDRTDEDFQAAQIALWQGFFEATGAQLELGRAMIQFAVDEATRGEGTLGRIADRIAEIKASIEADMASAVSAASSAANAVGIPGGNAAAGTGATTSGTTYGYTPAAASGTHRPFLTADEFSRTAGAADELAGAVGNIAAQTASAAAAAKSWQDVWVAAGQAVVNALQQVLSELVAVGARAATQALVNTVVGSVGGGVGSYATGGIAAGPQLAVVGDNSTRREAIVPLPNGRSIPVELMGDQSSGITVNLNVQAADSRSVVQLLQRDERGVVDLIQGAISRHPRLRNQVRGAF